jgi:hypothetical protein
MVCCASTVMLIPAKTSIKQKIVFMTKFWFGVPLREPQKRCQISLG